jgi:hypothetical protein
VSDFLYQSGEEVRCGDHIRFHGEEGLVEFVVLDKVGDDALDWYLEEYPGGGLMLRANNFGNVFLRGNDIDEELVFLSRKAESAGPGAGNEK